MGLTLFVTEMEPRVRIRMITLSGSSFYLYMLSLFIVLSGQKVRIYIHLILGDVYTSYLLVLLVFYPLVTSLFTFSFLYFFKIFVLR